MKEYIRYSDVSVADLKNGNKKGLGCIQREFSGLSRYNDIHFCQFYFKLVEICYSGNYNEK